MGKLSEKQKPGAIVGKTYTVTCIPSVKMANSFANLGYNNYTALKDIIDNSIDAMAKNVTVNIGWYKEGPKKHIDSIEIHDDGRGMSMLTLQQALTYGSNTSHAQDDLGCLGLGLKTAATSFGRRIDVMTSEAGSDEIHYGTLDMDLMDERNSYDNDFRTDVDPSYNQQSFTVVTISKLNERKQQTRDPKTFASTLKKKMARTYRHLIGDSSALTWKVNKTKVKPFDPLHWDHPECDHLTKGWVSIPNDVAPSLEFRACVAGKLGGINNPTQNTGVCWLRNHREIGFGTHTNPFWKYHPSNMGILFEIRYSNGELDEDINLSVTKQMTKDSLSQSLTDIIYKHIQPVYKKARKLIAEKNADNEPAEKKAKDSENLDAYGKRVSIHGKKLHTPPAPVVPKNKSSSGTKGKTRKQSIAKAPVRRIKEATNGRSYSYEWVSNWPGSSPMWHATLKDDNSIHVEMNTKHEFVNQVRSMKTGTPEQILCLNMFTALATAQLSVDDENAQVKRLLTYFSDNADTLTKNIPTL